MLVVLAARGTRSRCSGFSLIAPLVLSHPKAPSFIRLLNFLPTLNSRHKLCGACLYVIAVRYYRSAPHLPSAACTTFWLSSPSNCTNLAESSRRDGGLSLPQSLCVVDLLSGDTCLRTCCRLETPRMNGTIRCYVERLDSSE